MVFVMSSTSLWSRTLLESHADMGEAVQSRATGKRGTGPLFLVGNGLPAWTDGLVDTRCIDARRDVAALCDAGGALYVSGDAGRTWSCRATRVSAPSSVLIV